MDTRCKVMHPRRTSSHVQFVTITGLETAEDDFLSCGGRYFITSVISRKQISRVHKYICSSLQTSGLMEREKEKNNTHARRHTEREIREISIHISLVGEGLLFLHVSRENCI